MPKPVRASAWRGRPHGPGRVEVRGPRIAVSRSDRTPRTVRGHLDVGEGIAGGSSRTRVEAGSGDRQPAGHPAPAVTDDLEVGTSSPAARIQAATSAALSRSPVVPGQWPVCPQPGRSGATTYRPDAPSPARLDQIRADAVMPWMRRGRSTVPGQRERDAGGDRHRPLPRSTARPELRGPRQLRAADLTCPDSTSPRH